MPRLSARDRDRIRAIEAALGAVVDGGPPVLETVLPAVQALLELEQVCAYGVTVGTDGCELAFFHGEGFSSGLDAPGAMREWIQRSRGRFGLYDAARVEGPQQNRVRVTGSYRSALAREADGPYFDAAAAGQAVQTRLGIIDHDQLRVLICDGPRLLGWVGGFQRGRASGAQASRLRALVPALRRRLHLDAHLDTGAIDVATLYALLERVAGAALVVSAGGRLHLANSAGRMRYDTDPRGTLAGVRRAIRGAPDAPFEATPLRIEGAPPCFLIVERPAAGDPAPGVHLATRRYGLTPREAEVLHHLVQGASNRAIALELECAERTVEVHVGHLLDKLGVPSRAAAVARFWMDLAAT